MRAVVSASMAKVPRKLLALHGFPSSLRLDPRDCLKPADGAGDRVDRSVEEGPPPWWNDSWSKLATNTEG
jgi:hypothetical protein